MEACRSRRAWSGEAPVTLDGASVPASGSWGSVVSSDPVLWYRGVRLRHPLLDAALVELERVLDPAMPPRIVQLLGPTGVGKTTLLKVFKHGLPKQLAPVVYMTCPPVTPGRKGYDFGRPHWRLLAEAAGGVFMDDHQSPDAVAARLRAGGGRRDGAANIEEYRLGTLEFLRELRPRAVVLDEAQHMTRVSGARGQADQVDLIKDSVDRTSVPHVLAGTYELQGMVALSDQLARRSRVVHFPPYDLSDESDLDAFQTIFGQLVAVLPFSDPERSWSALQEHLLDVGVGSAGCVGVLKEWLERALQAALAARVDFIDWARMEQTALSDVDLFKIAHPIHEYRTAKRPSRADVERLLGVSRPVAPSSGKARGPRAKPGRRKPVRDPVGVDAAVKSA